MKAPKKIALLGFDCALTALVRKHINEGICPNFAKVFGNGTVAENALVPFPTITPPNWTVMATGAWPGTNDVTDFWRHRPGTTPEGINCHNSFNWDYVKSESFWESAEKVGKKSVILNYPMSINAHKRLKNAVVVGGGALTPGVLMDQNLIAQIRNKEFDHTVSHVYTFCSDLLITTDLYPGSTCKIKYNDAKGWTNVDDMGDSPLEADVIHPFDDSLFESSSAKWFLLIRDLGDGYNTLTLSPTKNLNDAFFTIKTGEWSKAFDAEAYLKDASTKTIRLKAKLISLADDDASDLRLYLSHGINTDGDYWCYPKEKASLLNKGDNVATNNAGMLALSLGWGDIDMWMENVAIHYDWLADTAEALLGNPKDWDIFYSHAHPTDYIYHLLMTELDANTCSSKVAHDKAWELHRTLYKHADRYLGRLLKLMDEDTLVVLISDHGATPDGPPINMMDVFEQAGLCKLKNKVKKDDGLNAEDDPLASVTAVFDALNVSVDTSVSRAIPARMCYAYVNLKGRDPEGIVEPKDYEKVQREIIDVLMTYVDPKTGKRPFCLALPKQEAKMMGLWGEQCGDVVYALWPEFSTQHGAILPTASYGLGDLRTLCVFYGPKLGIKQGFDMFRVCNIVDLVPTFCYLTGWPIPKDAEGSVIYQIMEDPNFRPESVK